MIYGYVTKGPDGIWARHKVCDGTVEEGSAIIQKIADMIRPMHSLDPKTPFLPYREGFIGEVNPEQLQNIFNAWEDKSTTMTDYVRCYCYMNGRYTALDNTTYDCWLEDFTNLNDCLKWLGEERG